MKLNIIFVARIITNNIFLWQYYVEIMNCTIIIKITIYRVGPTFFNMRFTIYTRITVDNNINLDNIPDKISCINPYASIREVSFER